MARSLTSSPPPTTRIFLPGTVRGPEPDLQAPRRHRRFEADSQRLRLCWTRTTTLGHLLDGAARARVSLECRERVDGALRVPGRSHSAMILSSCVDGLVVGHQIRVGRAGGMLEAHQIIGSQPVDGLAASTAARADPRGALLARPEDEHPARRA